MGNSRLARLDVLRGLAVLLVLGRHIPVGMMNADDPLLLPLCVWRRIGWIGVDLFFILSGFLVSGLLFREHQKNGSVRLGRFFIRRAIRIYPPFYVFLFLSLPLVFDRLRDFPAVFLSELFFIQSYSIPTLWNHTWSLAIEEHFYLFLGLSVLGLLKQKGSQDPFRSFLVLWPVLAAGCLLLRIATPYSDIRTLINSHLRFDALFFGVLLSYLYHFRRDAFFTFVRRWRAVLGVLSALCLVPAVLVEPRMEPWMTRFGLTLIYLGFGGILALNLIGEETPKASPGPFSRTLAHIGLLSYSLYLWHMPACEVVLAMKLPQSSPLWLWTAVAAYVLLAALAGFLAHRWVEKPSLAWRDRTFPA